MMKNKQIGFTLIELMITVAVALILATIAAPSFQNVIEKNRLSTASNELLSAIIVTRSEAAKRGSSVSMCTSNADQTGCDSTGGDYAKNGIVIFTDCDTDGVIDAAPSVNCDYNGNGMADAGDLESIIKVFPRIKDIEIKPNVAAFNRFVTYGGNGRVSNGSGFSFLIKKESWQSADIYKRLTIALTGRPKVTTEN